jgi:alpha-mannosidase
MTGQQRIPLYYTFGNHMHWVDMEWLWGYHVLPNSTRDMLHFCDESGAKGQVNFEGIGYEKMAVEAPGALNVLREAIASGQIEVAGASYGQPYGLFHGGESNVRQRVYGARTAIRLLGVRPRTFWEEEFDFFPQLPQMLTGIGIRYASLFFQWTWHTPDLPREELPAIWWEGVDGSRLLTAPRSALNLHQWPEDFAGLLDSPLLREMPFPGITQWLELMPSPDWMCRSELLLPQLNVLKADPRFELRFVTLPEYLELAREHAQPRRYTMDDVFHGMSIGKNGDLFRRLSRRSEDSLLTAESLSAMMGLFGRPYPHWDVYPTWELEEAWRELLSAQHHDNDECEGLCGHIGKFSYERSLSLSGEVQKRTMALLAKRVRGDAGRTVVYNPLGWERTAAIPLASGASQIVRVPAFGYTVVGEPVRTAPAAVIETSATHIMLKRGALSVTVDRQSGTLTQIINSDFPEGALRPDLPLCDLQMTRGGVVDRFEQVDVTCHGEAITITRSGSDGAVVRILVTLAPELDAVDIRYIAEDLPRPDAWMRAALQTTLGVALPHARLIHDQPYAVSEVRAEGKYLRKYPTGEWMTSPQVFEDIHNPFTALTLLDLDDGTRGLLYLHDGSQAMLRGTDAALTVTNILSMYDAWDENYFVGALDARFRLVPHGAITHSARWKLAQEFRRTVLVATSHERGGDLPEHFTPLVTLGEGVAATAFFRETEECGLGLDDYAGAGLGFPYVIRLVELDGQPAQVTLQLPGLVEALSKTNLMGERIASLPVADGAAPYRTATFTLRSNEIATLYADLVMGRKMPRNLDAFRFVWATVHRVDP